MLMLQSIKRVPAYGVDVVDVVSYTCATTKVFPLPYLHLSTMHMYLQISLGFETH